jgi:hypothetical protein
VAQYTEGQRLQGSDGNVYVVQHGVPVREGPSLAKPGLQYEGPQAAATLARTQQEIAAANATADSTAVKAKADAASAVLANKTAQETWDAAHPKGTGATVLGMDSLSHLPVAIQELDKALIDGRLAFPAGFALKAPWWQERLQEVAQADPTFDATNYNNRAKARATLLSGKVGASANALNTALGHVGMLSSQIGGTASHSFTPFNAVENSLSQTFGSAGITNFKDTASKLADELESVYRNGGGAEQGVTRQLRNLDPNMSLEQKQGIIQNAIELLSSKQAANLYQYNLGSGGKPAVDLLDPQSRKVLDQFPTIRDKYFAAPPAPLSGAAAALLHANGGTPPSAPPPGSFNGSAGPPSPLGSPPAGPGGVHDYSGMQGGPDQSLATARYRNVLDPIMSAKLNALMHQRGTTMGDIQALTPTAGPVDQNQFKAVHDYALSHPKYEAAVANNSIPTTLGERLASSPAAAGIVGSLTGATAGLSDVLGRTLAGPQWDANTRALSALNPSSSFAGNVIGGVGGMMGGEAALGKLAPGLIDAARASRVAPYLSAASDAAYGGVYGASENPENPLGGALTGAATGVGGGMFARGAIKGLGKAIAPTGGNLAPLYNANSDFRPTIGQALSASDSRFSRALGMGEQAAESIPGIGGIQTGARSAATDQMQRGAYNHALGELAPFNPILGRDVSQLPNGIVKGQRANEFLQKSMGDAQQTARSGMQFAPDPQYSQEVGAWQRNPDAMSLTTDQNNHVKGAISQAMNGRMNPDGTMSGQAYASAASDLARVARNWSGNPATAPQASYLRDFLSITDDAAKRASPPEAGALLDAANRGYAKSVIIENAAKAAGGEPTEFTGKQLLKSVQNSDPSVRDRSFLRGQALMQDYATAASKLSPSLADSGTPQRLAWMKAGGTGEAAALGAAAAMGHPMALAPWLANTAANLPGVRSAVGAAMAPRSAVLPPPLADAANLVGEGLYKRSNTLGMFGAPAALGYFGNQ